MDTVPKTDSPARAAGTATTITVRIPGLKPHEIVVGTNILGELKPRLGALGLSRDALIISSPAIFKLYGEKVAAAFKDAGCREVRHTLFADDEEHKTPETWLKLSGVVRELEETLSTRLLIVNLGGGIVGDVGAFVAATYARGRDYVMLPTTLLGDVDCGIGGKCGVNFGGKNMLGAFHQPRLVLADLAFLKSLPIRELRSGLAEVIKYGVILDAKLFASVEANIAALLDYDLAALEPVAVRCFQLKVDVVQQDERDVSGVRAKLNFGHTVGHALEAATDYTLYTHGEAIAVGMVCACEIAERRKMIDASVTKRVETLLTRAGLPTTMDAKKVTLDRVMQFMERDKKFLAGVNRLVLPTRLGAAELVANVEPVIIRDAVKGRIR